MSMDKLTKDKVKKYFTSKRFFILAAVFLLAVGTGVGTAMNVNKTLSDNLSQYGVETEYEKESQSQIAANDVTGVTVEVTERPTDEDVTVVKDEEFMFPVNKKIVKDFSNFVAVKSNTMNDWRVHNGIDFEAEAGQEVKAMQSGAVLAIYNSTLWGSVVEIDHGAGVVARYCGLSEECKVNANDVVEAGQVIGTIGEIPIEAADGIHLHLEVTKNGAFCDPLELFR